MSDKHTRTPHSDRPEHGSAAVDRKSPDAPWAAEADPAAPDPSPAFSAEAELVLSDVVGDANGEVVFFNDSELRRLAIATDAAVVADGRAGSHRTAAGDNVSGFSYLTFDNGITLYYQSGLDVVVRRPGAS